MKVETTGTDLKAVVHPGDEEMEAVTIRAFVDHTDGSVKITGVGDDPRESGFWLMSEAGSGDQIDAMIKVLQAAKRQINA